MKKLLSPKNLIILALIAGVGIAVFLMVRKTPLPEGLTQVNGRIEGDVVVVSSKYSGKITELMAREGDDVKKDQMLVRLDDPETRNRLAQSQQGLDALIARANSASQNIGLTAESGTSIIAQARGQVAQATSDIEAAQAAAGTATANVKTAQAAVSSASANVQNSLAAVTSASAALRQAEQAVSRYQADVRTARANQTASQRSVEAARSQAELSDTNARRFTNLAKEGVATDRQRDEYITAAAKHRSELQAAEATADSAREQVASRQSDVERAREAVSAARADLDRSKAQVSYAKAELERAQALVAAAKQEVSAANARIVTARGKKAQAEGTLREALTSPTQVAISRSQHLSALAQTREAKAKVDEQKSVLDSLFVKSPIEGKIVNRIRDTGEVVTAGSPILEVVNLDKLYLKAYVPEKEIGKVRLGLPAKIYVDAYPDNPFDATIGYISSTAEFTPKEVQTPDERVKLVYAVKLYLKENPEHRLTPGMPADAIIQWKADVPWQRPQY